MVNPNRRLLITILAGWASFAGLGLMLRQGLTVPEVTVIIDRSYCEPAQWQTVADRYQVLYEQHQKKQLEIGSVILFSDLGEETLVPPPEPKTVRQLKTYGRKDPARQEQLQQQLQQQWQQQLSSGANRSHTIEVLNCPVP